MKWKNDWRIHFNPQKCFVMRLTHARDMTRFNYILADKSLQETDNHPYLGVHIKYEGPHMEQTHPPNYCHSQPYSCIRNLYSCPQHNKKSAYTTLVRPLLEFSSSVWDPPHTKTLVNKIEMVQRRAARFSHNDYKTIEKGCVSEMIRKLNLEPLNIRRTNKRLTQYFTKQLTVI